VNLALNLGARVIFLLGFDMTLNWQGQSHWHDHYGKVTQDNAFERFCKGFETVQRELFEKHPAVQLLNVTDGGSNMPHSIKRISFAQLDFHLNENHQENAEAESCLVEEAVC